MEHAAKATSIALLALAAMVNAWLAGANGGFLWPAAALLFWVAAGAMLLDLVRSPQAS